ncbi:hypothetical protein [Wenyingzhuangia sp. IMCC45467]
MKKTRNHILVVAALCLSTVSCSDSFDTSFFDKEIDDPEFDISISGVPIGYINYTATQLFQELNEDLTVETGTDDIISFSYSQTLDGSGNADFVSVDDQMFDGEFDLLANANIPGGSYEYGSIPAADDIIGTSQSDNFEKVQSLTKSGGASLDVDLTAADFSAGTLTINITTTTEAQTEINFRIPSLIRKDNGNAYDKDFLLKSHSAEPNVNTITVNLSNYTFDFTELNPDNNTEVNNIKVELAATVTFNNGDNISTADKLNYTITLNNPEVLSAEGDFKQSPFNVSGQSFDLDFFNEIGNGTLVFENPILTLSATNQYGFPVGISLEGISTDATANNVLEIKPAGVTNNDNLEDNTDTAAAGDYYAIIDAGLSTGSVTSDIVLNSSNSNLSELLGEKPKQFLLNVSGTSNPNATGVNNNFFNVNNSLDVSVDVELPLHVTFNDVEFNPDPIELDLDDDIQENAKTLSLRVATKNTIPFNGTINLDFVDDKDDDNESNDEVLFSKSVDAIVAAPVGADGFSTYTLGSDNILKDENGTVINPNVPMVGGDFAITFNESEITLLGNANQVKLAIVFDTDTNGNGTASAVKVKSTDQVRIDLALKGDLRISTND